MRARWTSFAYPRSSGNGGNLKRSGSTPPTGSTPRSRRFRPRPGRVRPPSAASPALALSRAHAGGPSRRSGRGTGTSREARGRSDRTSPPSSRAPPRRSARRRSRAPRTFSPRPGRSRTRAWRRRPRARRPRADRPRSVESGGGERGGVPVVVRSNRDRARGRDGMEIRPSIDRLADDGGVGESAPLR
eukprot:13310-Pelagococcus_subviridis.AAC.2